MFGTNLHAIDFVVIAAYLALTVAIGLWFTKRASRSTSEYFLAGRSLPWWVMGTSIVATTFSSDTPLQVVGWVRSGGISQNWIWWSMATGHVISTFLFAPLWQRSGLTTDVEFITFRYEGTAARVLRIMDGLYQGLLVNSCVIAAVSVGMAKILEVMLNIEPGAAIDIGDRVIPVTMLIVAGMAALTILYSLLSGLYGVSYSDVPQFALSMAGAIVLAFIVVDHLGGTQGMLEQVRASPMHREQMLAIFPDLNWNSAFTFSVFIWFSANWWSRAPGHGAVAQRMLASRSERDSVLGMLWFNLAHYCLRPWPWIIVGVASIAILPEHKDDEQAYAVMINQFLGPGLKGLMVVGMLAAFMSTIDSHVNLASAYLVNDFYKPLTKRLHSERHYVLMGRLMMLPVIAVLIFIAAGLKSIVSIYTFLWVIMSGPALVLILRWFWWRVNAWSEISAMLTALIVGNGVGYVKALKATVDGVDVHYGTRMAITIAATTVVWLCVTFLTRPVSQHKLEEFYRRVRPAGPGWRSVAAACPDVKPDSLRPQFFRIAFATVMVFSGIVAAGQFVLGEYASATSTGLIFAISAALLWIALRGLKRESRPG